MTISHLSRWARLRQLTTALLIAMGLLGCDSNDGPPLGEVSGLVTLDGQPLPGVHVRFYCKGWRPSSAMTDADGRYVLGYLRDIKGAAIGTHTVTINRVPEKEGGTFESLPARYNSQSMLSRKVKAGQNEFNFELTSQ